LHAPMETERAVALISIDDRKDAYEQT
jgi:hypothetical protein